MSRMAGISWFYAGQLLQRAVLRQLYRVRAGQLPHFVIVRPLSTFLSADRGESRIMHR